MGAGEKPPPNPMLGFGKAPPRGSLVGQSLEPNGDGRGTAAAVGAPQCGHEVARGEIDFPQSAHETKFGFRTTGLFTSAGRALAWEDCKAAFSVEIDPTACQGPCVFSASWSVATILPAVTFATSCWSVQGPKTLPSRFTKYCFAIAE